MKVSFVLEEVNESTSNDVETLGVGYSRLIIVRIPERIRRAIDYQLSLFTWPTVCSIGLEQPRSDTGYKLPSGSQRPNLLLERSHAHGGSGFSETVSLEDWPSNESEPCTKRSILGRRTVDVW